MWIKIQNGDLINSDHVRWIKTGEATQVIPREHIDGTKLVRKDFPVDGFLLVAQFQIPHCIARYETYQESNTALTALYKTLGEGATTFNLNTD